jgi:hypothetical protein
MTPCPTWLRNTFHGAEFFYRSHQLLSHKANSQNFVEPLSSVLPCSQELATGLCFVPAQSTREVNIKFWRKTWREHKNNLHVNGDNIKRGFRKWGWGVVHCSRSTFNLPPVVYYSALKMNALRYSETPVNVYPAVWWYNTNNSMLYSHRCDNLKSNECLPLQVLTYLR